MVPLTQTNTKISINKSKLYTFRKISINILEMERGMTSEQNDSENRDSIVVKARFLLSLPYRFMTLPDIMLV
jgi:hypothetical protein